MMNRFHVENNFGLFIGKLLENRLHKHYALQLSMATSGVLTLTDDQHQQQISQYFFINSKVPHLLVGQDVQLTVLINPLSPIGHTLSLEYGQHTILTTPLRLTEELREVFLDFTAKSMNERAFTEFTQRVNDIFFRYKCQCEEKHHLSDERVFKALEFLDAHFDRTVTLGEVASHCFLSETRFLHLFKEKTHLNFRRYQLWNKLVKSMPLLKHNSITETAFRCGFTDSAHYTRTFVETFGITPKFLQRKE